MVQKKNASVEKFRKAVLDIADELRKGRKTLKKVEVPDTVHVQDLIVGKNLDTEKLRVWAQENAQVGLKYSGVVLLWMVEYLTRTLNLALINNAALRGIEDAAGHMKRRVPGKSLGSKIKAKVSNTIKDRSVLVSYLVYYMMMAGLLFGGQVISRDDNQNKKEKGNKEVKAKQSESAPVVTITEHAEVKKEAQTNVEQIEQTADIKTINPAEAQFVKLALAEYWPEIAVGLTELETYRAIPKQHGNEPRETNGLGCTWSYIYDSAGKLHRNANALGKTKTRDKAGNYEQCKRHLLYETLPALKQAISNKQNIGAQQAVALVMAGYQRPADMKGIAERISKAKTVQQVADAFSYYPGAETWRDGTLKRRWWCAAYAIGIISAEDLLGLPRDAFSRININNVYRNGHFLFGAETVEYALNRARTGDKSNVKAFLSDFDEGKNILARVSTGQSERPKLDLERAQQTTQDIQIEQSMKKLNDADRAFVAGKYQQAVDLYQAAIDADADNMEAYSSMALAYKKLGDENKSISYYEKCVTAVKDGNARMNANKSLLLDRDVKASSYYNAGLAREEMAKIYQARGDVENAQRNYDLAVKNYQTALENAQMDDLRETRKQVYQKAVNRALQQKQKVSKSGKGKVAYDSATQKLRQKNARHDIFLYGKEFDGNMA
ncbi:MAG: tetratricopeptide repeat protein [Alphaproteobacteria bacterium]|nr:tetratricopeptide repeat protein [Alphaproteobacteria bacterium]